MADKVFIFDTTMRDGEQSPGASMSLEEKLQISRVFDELGVDASWRPRHSKYKVHVHTLSFFTTMA